MASEMQPLGRVRPGMSAAATRAVRPHAYYRAKVLARLRDIAPASLLDVGCGEGALLASMKDAGCLRCVGLEVDDSYGAALGAGGIEAVVGRAEALPFPDRSIDVVVIEYSAHHLADLDAGLREAMRVAAEAVVVLDPWYDLSLRSQVVARDYDLWSKKIDRRLGLTHNPCPLAGDLARPFQIAGGYSLDITHRLRLHEMTYAEVEREAELHLARLGDDRFELERELDGILAAARVDGFSNDGAIQFVATRL